MIASQVDQVCQCFLQLGIENLRAQDPVLIHRLGCCSASIDTDANRRMELVKFQRSAPLGQWGMAVIVLPTCDPQAGSAAVQSKWAVVLWGESAWPRWSGWEADPDRSRSLGWTRQRYSAKGEMNH